jgi:tetratricopeptide (TPR) repeat protein
MGKKFRICALCTVAAAAALLAACSSTPQPVAADATRMEITQLAQNASDRNNYKLAMAYYQMIQQRFPNDKESQLEAEYEISFIHYKKKDYADAKKGLNDILDQYQGDDGEFLPQKYKILAQIVLNSITTKEKANARKEKKPAPASSSASTAQS